MEGESKESLSSSSPAQSSESMSEQLSPEQIIIMFEGTAAVTDQAGLLVSVFSDPAEIPDFRLNGNEGKTVEVQRDEMHHTLWTSYIRSDLPVKCFTGRFWGILYDWRKVAPYIAVDSTRELNIHSGDQKSPQIEKHHSYVGGTVITTDDTTDADADDDTSSSSIPTGSILTKVDVALDLMSIEFKKNAMKSTWTKWNEVRSFTPPASTILGLVRVGTVSQPLVDLDAAKLDFISRCGSKEKGENAWQRLEREHSSLPVFTYWVEDTPRGKKDEKRAIKASKMNEGIASHLRFLGTLGTDAVKPNGAGGSGLRKQRE